MLVRAQQLEIGQRRPVNHRLKDQVQTVIIRCECPCLHVVLTAVFLERDIESHLGKLMGNAVHEDHVFTGCRSIAESIAEIEAEGMAVGFGRKT